MRLHELAKALDLHEFTPSQRADPDITHGYASDLLSDVLAHAPAGGVLITVQVNREVITVASLAGLRAVIFSCGMTPDDRTVERAETDGLSLLGSQTDSFDVAGRLYESGLRGGQRPQNGCTSSLRGHSGGHRAEADWSGASPLTLGTGG
jgi:DRTGG domain